jgi:type IV pilus assembly protein PilM
MRNRIINTVLPDTETFVKLIEVPQQDKRTGVGDAVFNELVHHIPYEIDEVYIDWQIVGVGKNRGSLLALVGACPKEVVDQYIAFFHASDFVVQSLEIEAIPILRSIFKIGDNKESAVNRHTIVIDLGCCRSSIIFWKDENNSAVQRNTIEFSVSVPLSGVMINKAIAEALDFTNDQAEALKKKCGLSDDATCQGVVKTLLHPHFQELASRVRQAIDFHNTHFGDGESDKILLCGGVANLRNLDIYMQEIFDIPVFLADPLINIKNKQMISKQDALTYCTAIGLGLKDFYAL